MFLQGPPAGFSSSHLQKIKGYSTAATGDTFFKNFQTKSQASRAKGVPFSLAEADKGGYETRWWAAPKAVFALSCYAAPYETPYGGWWVEVCAEFDDSICMEEYDPPGFVLHPGLRYTQSGQVLIKPGDDLAFLVDALLESGYREEFCLALSFEPAFLAEMMVAGFLVMSQKYHWYDAEDPKSPEYLVLPKIHLERSILFFEDLRETKTALRLSKAYELRFDADFDRILDRCVAIHGSGWLTPPLTSSLKALHRRPWGRVRPVSFGLYRDGVLRAGEFGVVCYRQDAPSESPQAGAVYTSYSGYRDEDSAGTVQLILMARFLEDRGFAFIDFGMPLDYKDRLGARNVDTRTFVELFRYGRG
jgi:Leu/Phe-tRNA-protein transferase